MLPGVIYVHSVNPGSVKNSETINGGQPQGKSVPSDSGLCEGFDDFCHSLPHSAFAYWILTRHGVLWEVHHLQDGASTRVELRCMGLGLFLKRPEGVRLWVLPPRGEGTVWEVGFRFELSLQNSE